MEQFIERRRTADGAERANYQLFVHELCTLLELPTPDPAREDPYVPVTRDSPSSMVRIAVDRRRSCSSRVNMNFKCP